MAFTFQANEHGLRLGVAGSISQLQDSKTEEPHMTFFPAVFMLTDADDHEAHGLLAWQQS